MAKTHLEVLGLEKVKLELNFYLTDTAAKVEKNLVLAGLFLQRKSQEIVPIDTGALRASAFTRKGDAVHQGLNLYGQPIAIRDAYVGYTMAYSLWVHEMVHLAHKPGKEAKFLEKPLKENLPRIKEIIAKGV